jgi:nucleoid-associated protein EbfC
VAGEPPTLQDLAKRAQELRERLVFAKIELAEMEVTGSADGGMVTVTMRGDGEVARVTFDQAAVDEGDAKSLAALTLTAIRRAADTLKSIIADKMAELSASIAVPGSAGESSRRP